MQIGWAAREYLPDYEIATASSRMPANFFGVIGVRRQQFDGDGLDERMKMLANLYRQSADGIACHLRQQLDSTHGQLDDHCFERCVSVNGGDHACEYVVKAQSRRRAGGQHDFARWNPDADSCVLRDAASWRQQRASVERQFDESAIGVNPRDGRIEDASESHGFP